MEAFNWLKSWILWAISICCPANRSYSKTNYIRVWIVSQLVIEFRRKSTSFFNQLTKVEAEKQLKARNHERDQLSKRTSRVNLVTKHPSVQRRNKKGNETTNQLAKKGKSDHSCSWKNCGNSSAKQVVNVVIDTESSIYCTVDHLKRPQARHSAIFKRRIHTVELGPVHPKRKAVRLATVHARDLHQGNN